MLKTALLTLVISGLAAAQTTPAPLIPPPPPACLSGPVTKGSVTLTCLMIDATGGADFSAGYVLGLKGATSDPAVGSLRIEVVSITNPLPDGTFGTTKRVVIVSATAGGSFGYALSLTPTYDVQGMNPAPTMIASIAIQELKVSSSQSF